MNHKFVSCFSTYSSSSCNRNLIVPDAQTIVIVFLRLLFKLKTSSDTVTFSTYSSSSCNHYLILPDSPTIMTVFYVYFLKLKLHLIQLVLHTNVQNTIHLVMYSSHTNVCLHSVRLKIPQIT